MWADLRLYARSKIEVIEIAEFTSRHRRGVPWQVDTAPIHPVQPIHRSQAR